MCHKKKLPPPQTSVVCLFLADTNSATDPQACAILALLGSKQCMWGSLYLDAHGEKDA